MKIKTGIRSFLTSVIRFQKYPKTHSPKHMPCFLFTPCKLDHNVCYMYMILVCCVVELVRAQTAPLWQIAFVFSKLNTFVYIRVHESFTHHSKNIGHRKEIMEFCLFFWSCNGNKNWKIFRGTMYMYTWCLIVKIDVFVVLFCSENTRFHCGSCRSWWSRKCDCWDAYKMWYRKGNISDRIEEYRHLQCTCILRPTRCGIGKVHVTYEME